MECEEEEEQAQEAQEEAQEEEQDEEQEEQEKEVEKEERETPVRASIKYACVLTPNYMCPQTKTLVSSRMHECVSSSQNTCGLMH